MFTGIVSAVGRIVQAQALGAGASFGTGLVIETPPGWLDDVQPGDSVAISGACMTVTTLDAKAARFNVEVSAESLARTAGLARPGPVNLEKSLRAGDRLGGHLVAGHVDGVARVTRSKRVGESRELRLLAPRELSRFLAVKGSVAVDGVSLTVNAVHDHPDGTEITINVIAHTLAHTTLGTLRTGQAANLEADLLARYVERMLKPDDTSATS